MLTENTSLKNTAPAGNSNTNTEMVIGEINTYQRTILILAGSLLALLVLVAVAGTNGVQHLQSSAHKIAEGAMAFADYQVDSANSALTKDIFNGFKISEEGNGNSNGKKSRELKEKKNKKAKRSKNKKGNKTTDTDNSDLLSGSETFFGSCSNETRKKHCCYKPNQGTKSGRCDISYARFTDCPTKRKKFANCCPNGGITPCVPFCCDGCTCCTIDDSSCCC